jgi:hypothetical protein
MSVGSLDGAYYGKADAWQRAQDQVLRISYLSSSKQIHGHMLRTITETLPLLHHDERRQGVSKRVLQGTINVVNEFCNRRHKTLQFGRGAAIDGHLLIIGFALCKELECIQGCTGAIGAPRKLHY